MRAIIDVQKDKTLCLNNVVIKSFVNAFSMAENETISLETVVLQIENQIESKGAHPVGPLIQCTGVTSDIDEMLSMRFILQADKFVEMVDPGFETKKEMKISHCMYTRFEGGEEDIHIAYKKIEVEAYENDICLTGNIYTVFVRGDNRGNVIADIFMEKENE